MTEREKQDLQDTRRDVWRDQHGKCHVCEKVMMPDSMQLAHRIPQSKWALRKYGKRVIHHRANLRGVCWLECNDAVSISNHPVECDDLAMRIQLALDRRPLEVKP